MRSAVGGAGFSDKLLGASSSTYVEATWTQSLPDWIASHVRTFAALGGVPDIVVPDNLKAAVTRAHRYEPELNRTYADYVTHRVMWRSKTRKA